MAVIEEQKKGGIVNFLIEHKFGIAIGVIIILLLVKTEKMSSWSIIAAIVGGALALMMYDRYKSGKTIDLEEHINIIAKDCAKIYEEHQHTPLDYTNISADEIIPNSKKYAIEYITQGILVGFNAVNKKIFMIQKFQLPEYQHIKEKNDIMKLMAESLRREEAHLLKTQTGII